MADEEKYGLHSNFNIAKHKETFIDYLEVLIKSDGTVVYAVPSHQMKAELLAAETMKCSVDKVRKSCPKEYWFDYMKWLLTKAGAIAVWNEFYKAGEEGINEKQLQTIKRLKMHGVYKGCITQRQYAEGL